MAAKKKLTKEQKVELGNLSMLIQLKADVLRLKSNEPYQTNWVYEELRKHAKYLDELAEALGFSNY